MAKKIYRRDAYLPITGTYTSTMTPPTIAASAPLLALEIAAGFLAGLVDAIGGGGGLISLPWTCTWTWT